MGDQVHKFVKIQSQGEQGHKLIVKELLPFVYEFHTESRVVIDHLCVQVKVLMVGVVTETAQETFSHSLNVSEEFGHLPFGGVMNFLEVVIVIALP